MKDKENLHGLLSTWNPLILSRSFFISTLFMLLPAALAVSADSRFELRHGSSTLEVLVDERFSARSVEEIRNWLEPLSQSLLLAYGNWPRDRWRVQVIPTASSGTDPIPWAQVNRGDVDRVSFYVGAEPRADQLIKAWTGYHEFAHLLIPYRGYGDLWFSEGLASYYQNLLQARAGILDESTMWQKLHDGFERGAAQTQFDDAPLAALSDGMHGMGAYMRVYWSGAWYFLVADARLRQQSGGRLSLDSALARLNECCADLELSVPDMVERLDRLNRVVLFEPLYKEMRQRRGMPDHRDVFRSLGIRIDKGEVVLQSLGPGASLRTDIAQGDPR
ncbi:MAG: hypothetical protein AAGI11_22495 [Pseudomonadota bacterium]